MFAMCKFFRDELQASAGVKPELQDLVQYVDRMGDFLKRKGVLDNPRGLPEAQRSLQHVVECLSAAKRFYEKYKHGWGKGGAKWWVLPSQISQKAKDQTARLHGAFAELSNCLLLDLHQAHLASPPQPAGVGAEIAAAQAYHQTTPPAPPAADRREACDVVGCSRPTWNGEPGQCCRTCPSTGGRTHGPVCEARARQDEGSIWEIDMHLISIECDANLAPKFVLGKGQTGCSLVCEGIYSETAASAEAPKLRVAVKMATRLRLQRPEAEELAAFRQEVDLLCRLSHANIVTCYGAVTRKTDGQVPACTHAHTDTHARTRTYTHTLTAMSRVIMTDTHTHTNTHTHTHKHTHTHTHWS